MIDEDIKIGKVVEVLDEFRVVVNRGAADGVRNGDRFLIFELGPEIKDPESGESLGKLEVVRGTARVVHLQEKMATVQSDDFETSVPRTIKRGLTIFPSEEIVEGRRERVPLRSVTRGDLVKYIGR